MGQTADHMGVKGTIRNMKKLNGAAISKILEILHVTASSKTD